MIDDLIVQELRKYRAAHAAAHGNNLARICDALRTREQASGRVVLSLVRDKTVDRAITIK